MNQIPEKDDEADCDSDKVNAISSVLVAVEGKQIKEINIPTCSCWMCKLITK